MCLNCGCKMENTRHRPTDLIMDDVKKAADGQNQEVTQAVRNIQDTLEIA